jgi:hypothetical protein
MVLTASSPLQPHHASVTEAVLKSITTEMETSPPSSASVSHLSPVPQDKPQTLPTPTPAAAKIPLQQQPPITLPPARVPVVTVGSSDEIGMPRAPPPDAAAPRQPMKKGVFTLKLAKGAK